MGLCRRVAVTLGLLALALAPAGGAAAASKLPVLIELPPGTELSSLGANGFMVVGSFTNGTGGFYWTPLTGVVRTGAFKCDAVSTDGGTILGTAFDDARRQNAAIWQGGIEWRTLGSFRPGAQPCDALLSGTFGASDDGRVLVGLGWDGCAIAHAFRWEESTGMVDLGSTVPTRSSRANGISGDARVVIGWQDGITGFRQGARWIDGRQELFVGPRGPVGEAHGTNRDGSIIVGGNCDGGDPNNPGAWKWTASTGVQCFPVERRLQIGFFTGIMFATSEDGRVIGGSHSFGPDSEAVLWLDDTPQFLEDYLHGAGLPDAFQGWVNTGFIVDVSRDGHVLIGHGAGPTDFQAYIVLLPDDVLASKRAAGAVR